MPPRNKERNTPKADCFQVHLNVKTFKAQAQGLPCFAVHLSQRQLKALTLRPLFLYRKSLCTVLIDYQLRFSSPDHPTSVGCVFVQQGSIGNT